jgi:hypothetical protein
MEANQMSGASRVVEPELDMNRRGPAVVAPRNRLSELLRWLSPGGRPMGPPMRSVDRELQEVWPSRYL